MGKSQGPVVIAQTAGDTATGSASPRHGVSRDEATTEHPSNTWATANSSPSLSSPNLYLLYAAPVSVCPLPY